MYVRMSRARVRPGRDAEVKAVITQLKYRLSEVPEAKRWIAVLTEEGELVVMGFFADQDACRKTADVNARRWADAAHLFEGAPKVTEGDVLAFATSE